MMTHMESHPPGRCLVSPGETGPGPCAQWSGISFLSIFSRTRVSRNGGIIWYNGIDIIGDLVGFHGI